MMAHRNLAAWLRPQSRGGAVEISSPSIENSIFYPLHTLLPLLLFLLLVPWSWSLSESGSRLGSTACPDLPETFPFLKLKVSYIQNPLNFGQTVLYTIWWDFCSLFDGKKRRSDVLLLSSRKNQYFLKNINQFLIFSLLSNTNALNLQVGFAPGAGFYHFLLLLQYC